MSDDELYIGKKVPGRIYGSKSFAVPGFPTETQPEPPPRRARYLDRVFPDLEGEVLAEIKHERVLRTTPTGKRQIKLCVIEDPRRIRSLVLQTFDMSNGNDLPSKKTHFSLIGHEIEDLLEIASLAREGDFQSSGKFRIGVNQLERLDVTRDAVRALIGSDTTLIESVLRNQITDKDVVAVAYRKEQIRRFELLLRDPDFFRETKERTSASGSEAVWQHFFEDNHWIFGSSLFFSAAGAIDSGKLERAVAGPSIAGHGKRTDALLRTRGRIGALCFVEIKSHSTPLLKGNPYRPGVLAPSEELTGAISQTQRTIQLAEQTIQRSFQSTDAKGNPISAPAYLVRPRSVVVCGDLGEFLSPHGVNEEKYLSFELFRRHLQSPEIVTYDELLERAKLMVESST